MNYWVGYQNKAILKQFLLLCAYRVLLEFVYVYGVAVVYFHVGFVATFNISSNIVSWVLYIIFAVILILINKNGQTTFSKMVVYALFLLIYAPFSVLISNGMYGYKFVMANSLYWFILLIALSVASAIRFRTSPSFGSFCFNRERIIYLIGGVSVFLVLFISWRYTGFRINTSIQNVYELRSEAASFNFPTVIKYMFGWTRIINSVCLCISLIRRRYVWASVFFIGQAMSFGIDGMKSSMFIMFLNIGIYLIYRMRFVNNPYILLASGFNIVSILSILEMVVLKSTWIVYLVFYRMEMLPVQISSYFYDFFTNNEPDYFRTSFLRFFGIRSPYERINYMISGIYGGDYSLSANNGLLSDAITNMGFVGIVLMPIILVLFLRFVDWCSQSICDYLITTIGIYYACTISNLFFFTSLLTGGWLLAVALILFIDKSKEDMFDKRSSFGGKILYDIKI